MDVATLMVRVAGDTTDADQKLDGLRKKIDNFAERAGTSGRAMFAAFTAPLVTAGGAAFNMTADFERTMNVLEQTIQAPASAMAKLESQAISLGAETSFSANEAAKAMLELGKAGLSTEQIMGAIPGVLDLAAAGGVSLDQAATLAAASINTFGLKAEDVAYVADLMANAANASSANISDLIDGMRQGGFAFAMAGQDIDDLAASLAILTNVGLTGSDAGTALKNAFMRMMNPTQEAKDLMDELGISFYDSNGVMLELPEIIGMLNRALSGMTNEQRDAALSTLFLSDGMKAFVPLLEAGQEGFEKYLETVNRAGAAQESADAFMKGIAGAVETLTGSLESAAIKIALPFKEEASAAIRWVAQMIDGLTKLNPVLLNAALAFTAVLASAGPLVLTLGAIATGIGLLLSPVGLLAAGIGAVAAGFAALHTAAGDQPILSPATLRAIESWPQPLESLAKWAIGAGAGLLILWNAFKDGSEVDPAVMQRLMDTFQQVFGEKALTHLQRVATAISNFGDAVRKTFDQIATIRETVAEEGWFSPETIRQFQQLPGWLERIALWGVGAAAALGYLKSILTGDIIGQLWTDRAFEQIFGEEAVKKLRNFGEALQTLVTWGAGAAIALNLFKSALTGFSDGADFIGMFERLNEIFGGDFTQRIFMVAANIAGIAAAVGIFAASLRGMEGTSFEDFMKMFERMRIAFGDENARGLLAVAGHVMAIAIGVRTLATTGDIQPLADALMDIKDALAGIATQKITDLKTALEGLSSIGIEFDSDTGTLSVDLERMVQAVRDAIDKAFAGEDATVINTTPITEWVKARKAEVATALNQALGGEDASFADITPVVTAWANRVRQRVTDAIDTIFGGQSFAQEIGVQGPMSTDNPVVTWIRKRKQMVEDALQSAFVGPDAAVFDVTPIKNWIKKRKDGISRQLRTAFIGPEATIFDVTPIGNWVDRQKKRVLDEIRKQFLPGTFLGDATNQVFGAISKIQTQLKGFEGKSNADKLATSIGIVVTAFQTISGLRTEALQRAIAVVLDTITNIAASAANFVAEVDPSHISGFIDGIITEITSSLNVATDDTRMRKLGDAAGLFAGNLITKIGDALATDKLGEQIGGKTGEATANLLIGATNLVKGFADQLANVKWGQFSIQLETFVSGFISAFFKALISALVNAVMGHQQRLNEEARAARQRGPREFVAHMFETGLRRSGLGFIIDFQMDRVEAWNEALEEGQQAMAKATVPLANMTNDIGTLKGVAEETDRVLQGMGKETRLQRFAQGVTDAFAKGVEMLPEGVQSALEGAAVKAMPTIVRGLQAVPFPRGVAVSGLPAATTAPITAEPVEVQVKPVVDPLAVEQQFAQRPIEVQVNPDVNFVTTEELIAQMAGRDKPKIPVIPDWSGAVGIVPEQPFEVPVTGKVENVEPVGDLKVPMGAIAMLSQDGLASATSGIQQAADQLNSFDFQWPDYPTFVWPPLPTWEWPTIPRPSWVWVDIPKPTWIERLRVPRPGWLDDLLNWRPSWVDELPSGAPSQSVPGFASGVRNFRGGLAVVGEDGPELVSLPRGTDVFNADETERMLGGVHITIQNVTVANQQDIEVLAERVAEKIRRARR